MRIEGKRVKENIVYRKIYGIWKNMNDRCYKESSIDYKNYGGSGITVCSRWRELDLFIEDIDKIENFDLQLLIEGELSLDKDSKTIGNTIYCLENCVFISKEENNKYKPHQQKDVIGISPDNKTYEFRNQSEFARIHNLRQSSIGDCLGGKCKTHRGWRFYYKQE